jgi:osmotically-inducible protein OsmY
MAVREAQRKATGAVAKAAEKFGEGIGLARGKVADGLGDGRKVAGKQLKVAGQATGKRLKTARAAAAPRLEAARERAGSRLEGARKRSGVAIKRTRRRVGYWVAGEKPRSRKRAIGTGLLAGAAGAAAAFFLDPQSGKRRRSVARDWILARARNVAESGRRAGGLIGARTYGAVQSVRHRRDAGVPENDQVLAHKVESELFQGNDFPKGQININAENGVVVLRGQLDSADLIARIEAEARTIQGVRDIENLLHLPGTPAPTRR